MAMAIDEGRAAARGNLDKSTALIPFAGQQESEYKFFKSP
jgi:hypothetical protein